MLRLHSPSRFARARRTSSILTLALPAALGACGGAGDAVVRSDVQATQAGGWLQSGRVRAQGVAQRASDPAADQLFNFAEREFSVYFPSHASNLTEGEWIYRSYLATGVMLGIRGDEVHVVGGPFGAELRRVGRLGDIVRPALKVYPTSYENQNANTPTDPKIPHFTEIANLSPEPGEMGEFSGRIAFADFFQDGSHSAVAFSWMFKGVFPAAYNPNRNADSGAKLYFLQKNASGRWLDRTSALIRDGQRTTCISASFVEVADLNNDAKPDVLMACGGVDFVVQAPAGTNLVPYWLSKQYAVLSQPDGSYRLTEIPVTSPNGTGIYAHQAAVADIDGDGNADILYTDAAGNSTPFVMWGRGDGSFRQDMTRFPADMKGKAIFSIRAIPVDGKLNVIVAGNAPGSKAKSSDYDPALDPSYYGVKVLHYVNGAFRYVQDLTAGIPQVKATGLRYSLGLDFVYHDGAYYAVFVDDLYVNTAYVRFDARTGASRVLLEYTRPQTSGDISGNIKLVGNELTSIMSGCGPGAATNPLHFYSFACGLRVPIP